MMNPYVVNQVNTSSPGELLILVITKLKTSVQAYLENINPLENHSKAILIVTTLSDILDRDSGLPWIDDMTDLYHFILMELSSRDSERIFLLLPIIDNLLDTWKSALQQK